MLCCQKLPATDITVNYSMHTATDSATFDTDYALIVGQGNGGVAASGYTRNSNYSGRSDHGAGRVFNP